METGQFYYRTVYKWRGRGSVKPKENILELYDSVYHQNLTKLKCMEEKVLREDCKGNKYNTCVIYKFK